MPRKIHAPEDIVFVGRQFFPAPIPNDAHIVLGAYYPRSFEHDDPRTPAERYETNRNGMLGQLVEATQEADGPLEPWEIRNLQANADFWQRCERATEMILAQNGYFPPVYESPAVDSGLQEQTRVVIPHPRAGESLTEQAASYQNVA